ncbi:hypothetical protein SAMN05421688_2208 [Poseidonocella pacifica]|uniref:DUF2125 domain-containing protein n=1 Tax=Poseidonocella pacifica TaxID=871651 RepID=A0A1I0XFF1_9RHOB|nr:DUF2125 domain-containing protein [Poseidonocella pacifica]SFA99644.1 hypothetical protein SAMN05421688_2208 [Poseidonocella pacifica]
MRALLIIVLVAGLGWCGYWFIGASAHKRTVANWFELRQAEGWDAGYERVAVRGFPNRFDTTLTEPRLAAPQSGWGYEAPFLQMFSLSYKPHHLIAVWPVEWQITSPQGPWTISHDDARASIVFAPRMGFPLERATFVASDIQIDGPDALDVAEIRLAVERLPVRDAGYHLGLAASDLRPAEGLRKTLDPGADLPAVIEAIALDAEIDFDRAWDNASYGLDQPQPTRINLDRAEARWGDLRLRASGALDIGADGRADGEITLDAQNWRLLLDLIRGAELLSGDLVDQAEGVLGLLARLSGDEDRLKIPLTFTEGQMRAGPLPLGPAPLFRLR